MAARVLPLALGLALILVAGGIAGCIEPMDDPPADPAGAGDALGDDAAVPVDDGSGFEDRDLGHMPHMHDYWDGRERVTLMREDVPADHFRNIGFTFFQAFGNQKPAAGGAFLTLPDGAIVYEGTGVMEVTLTWEDPLVTALTLRYRSAAGPDWSPPLPAGNGETIVIEVTPAMTDMPHMTATRWAFIVEPAAAGDFALGAFHAHVDIVRVRDIMAFPGHPDLFHGATEKVILDADASSTQKSGILQFVDFMTGSGTPADEQGIAAAEVVPMETVEMRVDVHVTSATTTVGDAGRVYLLYQSADTNQWRIAEQVSADPATGAYAFVIPVDMRMVDSPYATDSQWRFDVFVSAELVDGTDLQCGGCADAQVEYHILVTAYAAPQDVAPEPADGGAAARAALPPVERLVAGVR